VGDASRQLQGGYMDDTTQQRAHSSVPSCQWRVVVDLTSTGRVRCLAQNGADVSGRKDTPSLLGALMIQDRQRIMTYGHLVRAHPVRSGSRGWIADHWCGGLQGLALRKNQSQPIPGLVKQCDLAEHRRLSPSLDEFILGRNDGRNFLPVDLIARVNDEVMLAFLRMASDPSAVPSSAGGL
jgi:hypothetical protein